MQRNKILIWGYAGTKRLRTPELEDLQTRPCQRRIDTIDSWKQNKITESETQMIIDHLFTIYLNTSHHLYKNTQWENQNHRFMFGHKTIREWS